MPLVAVFSIYSQSTFISLPEQMSVVAVVGRVEQQLVLVPPLPRVLLISTIVLMYARNTIKHSLCVSLFSRE